MSTAVALPETEAPMRPSLLPLIDGERGGCPKFVSLDNAKNFEDGIDRHGGWRGLLTGNDTLASMLQPEDREGIEWAASYVREELKRAGFSLSILRDEDFERQLTSPLPDFSGVMVGHIDLALGNHVFDLKWREHDYTLQVVCYGLMWREAHGLPEVHCHKISACVRRSEAITINDGNAAYWREEIARDIAERGSYEKRCDFCGWCARRLQCETFNAPANAVAKGREDWGMQTYHCSAITSPEDMAKAIELAGHLRKWCDAVDYFKREWALKQGIDIPGYKLKNELGDREIVDLNEALRLSGLPLPEFLASLKCRVGEFKKRWAKHRGVTLKVAEAQMDKELAGVMHREPEQKVVKIKTQNTQKGS
jgi:hypothetical protein